MSHFTDFENDQECLFLVFTAFRSYQKCLISQILKMNNINAIIEKEVKIIFSTLVTRDGISKPIFQYWKGANNAV